MKEQIRKIPILGNLARRIYSSIRKPKPFPGSREYWEQRYASGGNSGVGSYDKFRQFKADVINAFVTRNNVISVIEFGCGDGKQLEIANYQKYLGLDVSETVISSCRQFAADASKAFELLQDYKGEKADLSLSLDVIYHLVEDEIFEKHMRDLFAAANRHVIIYSSNTDDNRGYEGTHVRHRKFTKWVEDNLHDWRLAEHIPNKYPYKGDYTTGSFADFFIYART